MRMARCRQKLVLNEIYRLIQSSLDLALAVSTLNERQRQAKQTLPAFIRSIASKKQGRKAVAL
jgi:hypothetical protein